MLDITPTELYINKLLLSKPLNFWPFITVAIKMNTAFVFPKYSAPSSYSSQDSKGDLLKNKFRQKLRQQKQK